MKKIIYILLFVLAPVLVFSQQVQQAEYYVDTDPGVGLASPMAAYDGNFNDAFETILKTNASGWTLGFHTIGVRIKDNAGNWGPAFITVINVQSPYVTPTINIAAAELFWDTDPGAGNGTAMLAFDGNFDEATETAMNATPAPSLGVHILNIRVKDANNNWGPVFKTIVDVQNPYVLPAISVAAAECFWDTDPGQGNGTAMLAFDGNFNSAMETLLATSFGTPGLGMHVLHVRMRDINNNWGPVFRTIVDVQNPWTPVSVAVTAVELFWDTDPGQGNATPMLALDGNFSSAYEAAVKTEQAFFLAQGLHVLHVRALGANGQWSAVFRTVIYLDSCMSNPVVTATANGPTTFCMGDSVQLNASGSFSNYYWRRNGVPFGGNTNSVWVTQSGNYSVTALDTNGCPATSSVISVTANDPNPVISPAGPLDICTGDSVMLDAGSGFATYLWSNGATTQTTWVYGADTSSVIVTDVAGCTDTSSGVISSLHPLPPAPVITQDADTLTSSSATGNQWYLNGNPIVGATGQNYVANQSGSYTVVVSDVNGCTASSAPYAYIHMEIGTSVGGTLFSVVYPNPVGESGTLLIHAEGYQGTVLVEITDVTGRVVSRNQLELTDGEARLPLENGAFASGLYVYTIASEGEFYLSGRFTVQ